jgi:hypothetical protein
MRLWCLLRLIHTFSSGLRPRMTWCSREVRAGERWLAEAKVVDALAPIRLHLSHHAVCDCDPKIERRKGLDGLRDVPAGSSGESWV